MKLPISLRAFAALFAFGAIFLTALDAIHVHTHTLAYVRPFALDQAWWVPLLMGSAASIGGALYVWGWSRLGGSTALPRSSRVALAVMAFAVMYAASGLLPATAVTKLVVIAVAAVVIFREVDGSRAGSILLVVGAIGGTLAEAANHGFFYLEPDFFRVPMWLPALYACATPAMGQLARRVAARFPTRSA